MRLFLILTLAVSLLHANDYYQKLWERLELRTDATVNYYRESARSYKIRKQMLETGETISTTPYFQGSANDNSRSSLAFGFGNQASWNHPKFDSYFAFSSRDNRLESANLQFLYTLKSDKKSRVAIMDTLIEMTGKKASLQREAMLFADFQQLLNYKVQYDYMQDELKARTKMGKKGEAFLTKLKRFVAAGVLPRNAIQSISLFLDNNTIRMNAVVLESTLLIDNVIYLFDINVELFLGLEIDSLLPQIQVDTTTQYESYNWRLDSLNAEIQRAQMYEQDMNSWKLSAGAAVNYFGYEDFATVDNKLQLKFDYTFHKKEFRGYEAMRRIKRENLSRGVPVELDDYKKLAMDHAKKATQWIEKTLERIQLGEIGIMHEISQNLDIILNQQLRYYMLRSTYFRRELSQLRSMAQLPPEMRWQR